MLIPFPVAVFVPATLVHHPVSIHAYAHKRVSDSQWLCLKPLWKQESHWRKKAMSPTGEYYGIPQGPTDILLGKSAHKQVRWGIRYIRNRYGTMCSAWSHEQSEGWY